MNALLGLGSLISVALLWQTPTVLVIAMLILTGLIFKLKVNNDFYLIDVTGFIFGPIAEIIAINHGAWQYTSPSFAGIPLWLPLLWGNAALFIVNTYILLSQFSKKK